jgi:hypothetical protein
MKLSQKIKTGLDETRMLILGLWYGLPLVARWRGARTAQYQGSPAE